MKKAEMIASVKTEIGKWQEYMKKTLPAAIRRYDTGPDGHIDGAVDYAKFQEIDVWEFIAACAELKTYVEKEIPGYSGHFAMSASGKDVNVNIWSFLCEPFDGKGQRKLDYHIKISNNANPYNPPQREPAPAPQ